jgi:hypothetical protein
MICAMLKGLSRMSSFMLSDATCNSRGELIIIYLLIHEQLLYFVKVEIILKVD